MVIARVVGNVVSTIKCEKHLGLKLMVVQRMDSEGNSTDDRQIAVDWACAGVGDIVLLSTDGGAANTIIGDLTGSTPIDCVICGVIDEIHME